MSAAPEEPPDPALIVALRPLYPAQIAVPLAGVATARFGATIAEAKVQRV